jgi:hypothetical protein
MKKRFKIIKEIIETEDVFIQDMSVLEEGYSAFSNECPAISSHNKQTIFGRTGSVVGFSKLFYKEIVQSSLDYVNRTEEDVDGASYDHFQEWDKEVTIGEAFWSSVCGDGGGANG